MNNVTVFFFIESWWASTQKKAQVLNLNSKGYNQAKIYKDKKFGKILLKRYLVSNKNVKVI